MLTFLRHFLSAALFSSVSSESILDSIRPRSHIPYQSHRVSQSNYAYIRDGDRIPANAVRALNRPLRFHNRTYDVYVALWFRQTDGSSLWGSAWEEKGVLKAEFVHNSRVKSNKHPEVIATGYYILTYSGTPETNGFRFKWVKAINADDGVLLYPGTGKHVPAVYKADENYEYLGDGDFEKREMTFTRYDDKDPYYIYNHNWVFDKHVWVLTKERCSCQCSLSD